MTSIAVTPTKPGCKILHIFLKKRDNWLHSKKIISTRHVNFHKISNFTIPISLHMQIMCTNLKVGSMPTSSCIFFLFISSHFRKNLILSHLPLPWIMTISLVAFSTDHSVFQMPLRDITDTSQTIANSPDQSENNLGN